MQRKDTIFWAAYFSLALLLGLRVLPYATGFGPLWGTAQLPLLPFSVTLIFGVLAAAALALPFMPQVTSWGDLCAGAVSSLLYESKIGRFIRIGVVLALGVLFWLFSMRTHFLGDGYTYIYNLGSTTGHWIKWTESGTMLFAREIRELLGQTGEPGAEMAMRLVSIISGVVTFWFLLLITKLLSDKPAKRLLILVSLAIAPTMLLFFGYAETYPLLWAPSLAFLYFGLRYLLNGDGVVWALLSLLIATAAHLQALIFYPAALFLLFSRGKGLAIYVRYRTALLTAVVVVTAITLFLFYRKYTNDLAFQNIFLWAFSGKPSDPGYALFSAKHWGDIVNETLLVAPLILPLLVLGIGRIRSIFSGGPVSFLALLTVGGLLFMGLVEPGLSMPRDWDLFAICVLPVVLLLLFLIDSARLPSVRRLSLSFVIAALIFTLPYLMVNLNQDRSVTYIKRIIDRHPEKSLGSMSILNSYYRGQGLTRLADSVSSQMQKYYPNFYRMRLARQAVADGNLKNAERLRTQLVPDIFWKDWHLFLAELYAAEGQLDSALAHAQTAVQLMEYYEQSYFTLGYIYMARGELDLAMKTMYQGYALNQKYPKLLVNIATVFEWQEQHDSAVYYAEQAAAIDSTSEDAQWLLARAYFRLGDHNRALEHGRRFIAMGHPYRGFDELKKQLLELMPELEDNKRD